MPMPELPLISVIIPCRNEKRFIGGCVEAIIANDYPNERIEVLVVDGMSDDGTRKIMAEYSRRYPFVRVVDNPKKSIPSALNIGIENASGEIIARLDAHSKCERVYLSQCVKYLTEYPAASVGGRWVIVPRDDTLVGRAIALVLSHRFGVGDAHYRLSKTGSEAESPRPVDTVPYFACRRDFLDKIGAFEENLERSEDIDFNRRLRQQGGTILLVPGMVSYYYALSDLRSFWKHAVSNGIWAVLPLKFTRSIPVSLRHLVPLAFVCSLAGFGILSLVQTFFLLPLLLIVGLYSLLNVSSSALVAIRERNIAYLLIMPVVFGALHIGYGLGSLIGLVRVITSKLMGTIRSGERS